MAPQARHCDLGFTQEGDWRTNEKLKSEIRDKVSSEAAMNIDDVYPPFSKHFRTRRMQQFQKLFETTFETRILDVGGSLLNWRLIPLHPRLTILNLTLPSKVESHVTWVVADGRSLPFKDRSFDIVYSNSVIEHLGDFTSQQGLAKEIARVGIRYYVQTPNHWFPVEPHLLTPFIQFMPKRWQRALLRNFTIWGLITRPSRQRCERYLKEVQLLDYWQLSRLFPGAKIYKERFLGFTKSLIAARLIE